MKTRTMHRLLALLLSLLLVGTLVPAVGAAYTVLDEGLTDTGVKWQFKSNGTLSLNGKGALYKVVDEIQSDAETVITPWEVYKPMIKKVVISAGITEISHSAFSSCSALTGVSVPKGVKTVGDYAFAYCSALKKISLPDTVTSVGCEVFDDTAWFRAQKDGVVYYGPFAVGWKGERNVSAVKIKSGTLQITPGVLSWFENLKTVTLPAGLKVIGDRAFSGSGLTAVTIPKSVSKIGSGVLNYCDALKTIKVESGNKRYASDKNAALYDNSTHTLMKFAAQSSLTAYTVKKGTKTIGESAFSSAAKLKKVTIANTVKTIDELAFSECGVLQGIHIPDSVTSIGTRAFQNGYQLASITGGKGVVSLGIDAVADNLWYYQHDNGPLYFGSVLAGYIGFYNGASTFRIKEGTTAIAPFALESISKDLRSVSLPASLKAVGEYAFSGAALTSVTIPKNIRLIETSAFIDCRKLKSVKFNDGLQEIRDYAFSSCESLKDVQLPNSLQSIGAYAFSNSGLSQLTIPAKVKTVGDTIASGKAFKRFLVAENSRYFSADANGILFNKDRTALLLCPSAAALKSYDIPATVTMIGDSAFSDQTKLGSVFFPQGLERIGYYAFENCSALTSITLPDSVTDIEPWAFTLCKSLTSIKLPSKLHALSWGMFSACESLRAIKIPAGVIVIESYAFSDCRNLSKPVFSEGVRLIERDVFSGCSALTGVTLPKSLQSLNCWAFNDCKNLKKIVIKNNAMEITEYNLKFEGSPFSSKVTFYAADGSAAQAYCKAHKLRFKAV